MLLLFWLPLPPIHFLQYSHSLPHPSAFLFLLTISQDRSETGGKVSFLPLQIGSVYFLIPEAIFPSYSRLRLSLQDTGHFSADTMQNRKLHFPLFQETKTKQVPMSKPYRLNFPVSHQSVLPLLLCRLQSILRSDTYLYKSCGKPDKLQILLHLPQVHNFVPSQ